VQCRHDAEVNVWHWLGAALYVAFFVWSIAQILGFRRRPNRAATASHLLIGEQPHVTRLARGWQAIQIWRERPRPRLTAEDWNPRAGFMFLPSFFGVCLLGAGLHAAVGAHQNYRLVSLPLLGAGAALVTLVVLFVLRPVAIPGGRFELRSAGYDPAEVDRFLATVDGRTPTEIDTVTFHFARPGYEFAAVDDKLDRLRGGTARTDGRHRPEGKHTYHARRP
jgi:hypothetical protein